MKSQHRPVVALLFIVGSSTCARVVAAASSDHNLLAFVVAPPPSRRFGEGTSSKRASHMLYLSKKPSPDSRSSTTTATTSKRSPVRAMSDRSIRRIREESTTASLNPTTKELTLQFELVPSILDISPEDWDTCARAGDGTNLTTASSVLPTSPFVEHAWIRCLEETGCAAPSTGWIPQHVRLRLGSNNSSNITNTIAGFLPLYIKGHSLGEFVFDQPWADAAYQNGIDYYPKLLVGIPFTPATGPRVLWHPSVASRCTKAERKQLLRAVGSFLRTLALSNELSSVHVNFLTDDEATDWAGPIRQLTDESTEDEDDNSTALAKLLRRLSPPTTLNRDVYLRRTSLQYHWVNINPQTQQKFDSFQEYLSCFKSKRRITIKRERAKVLEDAGIRVDVIRGRDIVRHDGLVERMFDIYKSTIDKMMWGRQYLTLEFFRAIVESDFVDNLCFLCARRNETTDEFRSEDVFAGTFNVIKDGVFYGRYWGCLPDYEVRNLHFEVCYWSAIEYCIEHGLDRMEPGAGGGDYKWARGFDPALTHSVHYICNPGLRRGVAEFLDYETENNVEVQDYLRRRSSVAVKTYEKGTSI